MKKLTFFLTALMTVTMALAVDLNPDPSQGYILSELSGWAKTPVSVRTVLGGDYGQEPVDLKAFFLRVDAGWIGTGGELLMMQTDPTDERWKDVGVAAGMSGSPIYDPINGKILGALSYGGEMGYAGKILFFATPIESMNRDLGTEERSGLQARSAFDCDSEQKETPILSRSLLPIMVSGISDEMARKLFKDQNYHLVSKASGSELVGELKPGSAIAVPLITGDVFNAYAIGTATTVFQNQVMAFGHPFFNVRKINLPLYGAVINGIDHYGQFGNSKNGALVGDLQGVINRDKATGIAGVIDSSAKPPIIPVRTKLKNRNVSYKCDHQVSKFKSNSLMSGNDTNYVSFALAACIDQNLGYNGPQAVKLMANLKFSGYNEPVKYQIAISTKEDTIGYDAGSQVYFLLEEARSLGFKLERVDMTGDLFEEDISLNIESAELVGRLVAGTVAHLKVITREGYTRKYKNIFLDIPDYTQGASIDISIGTIRDLYESSSAENVVLNPTIKQWAKGIAERYGLLDLVVKMKITLPISDGVIDDKPIVIMKKIGSESNKIIKGTAFVYGIIESDPVVINSE
jgi:hypothetical protein